MSKREKDKKKNVLLKYIIIFLIAVSVIYSLSSGEDDDRSSDTVTRSVSQIVTESETQSPDPESSTEESSTDISIAEISKISLDDIPEFTDKAYIAINKNIPVFSDEEKNVPKGYEYYSPLDNLGRCGVTFALIGKETMPTQERGNIGSVRPSGWHTVRYSIVDGSYLYNRCHLIGYQLAAENANERNLITGTRYLNVTGMLPFENMVADYVKETNNHVLYKVTPIFDGDNLLASGVQMEAYSLEDDGDGISFNVFCYNAQPGIKIDYATGDSSLI